MKQFVAYLIFTYPAVGVCRYFLPFCQLCGGRLHKGEPVQRSARRFFPPYQRHAACHCAYESHPRLQVWHRIRSWLIHAPFGCSHWMVWYYRYRLRKTTAA